MESHEKKKALAILSCFGINTTQAREIVAMVQRPTDGEEEVVQQLQDYLSENE